MPRILLPASLLLPALLLSACAQAPMRSGGPLPPSAMACNADPARWAIGDAASGDLVERVREASHSRTARVLHPGQMVTMEFAADRVNLRVDDRGIVLDVTCG